MQKSILLLLVLISSFNAFAGPSCLRTMDCMEYNGQIIDLRSDARKAVDSLKMDMGDHDLPVLSKAEYSKLAGSQGSQYFIPIELRDSDMMILAGALSLGVVVFANDREIMDFVQENKTPVSGPVATIGNMMGREAIAPIAAGAYFIGAVMKNGKLKKVGLFTVATGLATQIVTEAFKKTFQRIRPNGSDDPYDFFEDHNNSFFSGHTSGAFSLATVIAEVYKDKPLVPYIAYGLATMTAYARMHDKKHWATDVMMGAVAGHLVTKIMIRSFEKAERTGSGLLIIPQLGVDENGKPRGGVQVQWRPRDNKNLQCSRKGLQGSALIQACMDEAFSRSERF